jgi:hypothetical protein
MTLSKNNIKNNKERSINTRKNKIILIKSKFKNIKKYNIILDIDECLVNSQIFNSINTDFYITNGPHNFITFTSLEKKDNIRNDFITFLRPGLQKFMSFLFENFNVGFWTTGTTTYAKNLITELFDKLDLEDEYKNLICFFTRVKANYDTLPKSKTKVIKYKTYDLISKKTYFNSSGHLPVKDLNILFNNEYFKNKNISPNNTILIDDNLVHNGINNGHNVLSIKKFNYLFTCDTLLQELQKYLTTLLLKNNKLINIHNTNLKQFLDVEDSIYNEHTLNPKLDYIKKVEDYCNKKITKKKKISNSKKTKLKYKKTKGKHSNNFKDTKNSKKK